MKLTTLTLYSAVFGLSIGAATTAHAIVPVNDYTYTFKSTDPGDTDFNGSTVTLQGALAIYSVTGWDLVDTGAPAGYVGHLTSTPLNSYVSGYDITAVYTDGFTGNFGIDASVFSGTYNNRFPVNNVSEFSGVGNVGAGSLSATYEPITQFPDPPGNWILTDSTDPGLVPPASVPDMDGTFPLFAGALSVLGVFGRRFKGLMASR